MTALYVRISNVLGAQPLRRQTAFKVRRRKETSKSIYLAICKCCHKQYVGRAWRQFNIRFNLHRSQIKKKKQYCELFQHVLTRRLNLATDFEIVIIEQLKQNSNLTEEKQKAVLKHRETFWQRKLQTLVWNGLNKREG